MDCTSFQISCWGISLHSWMSAATGRTHPPQSPLSCWNSWKKGCCCKKSTSPSWSSQIGTKNSQIKDGHAKLLMPTHTVPIRSWCVSVSHSMVALMTVRYSHQPFFVFLDHWLEIPVNWTNSEVYKWVGLSLAEKLPTRHWLKTVDRNHELLFGLSKTLKLRTEEGI